MQIRTGLGRFALARRRVQARMAENGPSPTKEKMCLRLKKGKSSAHIPLIPTEIAIITILLGNSETDFCGSNTFTSAVGFWSTVHKKCLDHRVGEIDFDCY